MAKYNQISIKTLLKYPLALYQPAASKTQLAGKFLEQFGQPNIAFTSDKSPFVGNIIAQNIAVGFISGAAKPYLDKQHPHAFKWLKIKDIPKSATGLLIPKHSIHHPLITACLSELL